MISIIVQTNNIFWRRFCNYSHIRGYKFVCQMTGKNVYFPTEKLSKESNIVSLGKYHQIYNESVNNSPLFWGEIAKSFHWDVLPNENNILSYNFNINEGNIFINWFAGGKTNISYNCLDRHVENGLGDKIAFYWEGNDPEDIKSVSYKDLLNMVTQFGAALRNLGIKKGDRVAIYMPMVLELIVAVLACARIGAIHSVVFGGFSAESLAKRIFGAECRLLLTCDGNWRGSKFINLLEVASQAMELCEKNKFFVEKCVVLRHVKEFSTDCLKNTNINGKRPFPGYSPQLRPGRDLWWHDLLASTAENSCEVEYVDAEDPLFLLYTSGSTGQPKGILHTTGGYMVYAHTTTKYTFNCLEDDVFWCTADIGWITGHTYSIYGPLLNGMTSVIFEGIPNWPDFGRYWSIVDRFKVTKFYTSPTAIRLLIGAGNEYVKKHNRDSLKVLGTVGEPINPSAWEWYYHVVGEGRCSIVDTFWQTETGGHMITSFPGIFPMKPGCAGRAFFGVKPKIMLSEASDMPQAILSGYERKGDTVSDGHLVFATPWPGIARTIYGDHKKFEETYFRKFPGYFMTGDGAQLDQSGDFWITGRIDDMLNISGHLLSTSEVESVLVSHPLVVEAAAVSRQHDVKGECLHCFITLMEDQELSSGLKSELIDLVRARIAPFAAPDYIQAVPMLPKTRSGKIMRRILRKIVNNDPNLGDISSLADPSCLATLVNEFH